MEHTENTIKNMPSGDTQLMPLYTKRQWQLALMLFVSYLLVYGLRTQYLPDAVGLEPGAALAIAALFFGGQRLWVIALITATVGSLLTSESFTSMVIGPISVLLQALAGGYFLQKAQLDPLFRRYRDTFYLVVTVVLVSFIHPSFLFVSNFLNSIEFSRIEWGHAYIATLFSLLITLPFALRWTAKLRFNRSAPEIFETLIVFVALLSVLYAYFARHIESVSGISVFYFLLIPLFWIALRLRPRFISLALVIVSLFAFIYTYNNTPPSDLTYKLFEIEIFLIGLAISFFTVTSLEEDRRVSTNLISSQLATLQNALARISSESQAKNNFIAVLAHELRNPLAPVVSGIDFLKLRGPKDPETSETLDMMADRMNIARRLLDDLLDISRISEGKIELRKEVIDLDPVIKRAILSTSHHRREKHQRLVFKGSQKPLHIAGNPLRLEQIFSNLLTNASTYSKSGDTIKLSIVGEGSEAKITVEDEGIGLTAENIRNIFLPFHQAHHGSQSKGLGIGLSLASDFVEMHGGSIVAQSAGPGKGSTFTVLLPTALPFVVIQAQNQQKEVQKVASLEPKEKLRVLIVDDNDAAAGALGRLLELQGCTVSYAYEGTQGIGKTLELNPDVVLLDVGLPDQDGYEVLKAVRAQGFTGRVIALTGYSTKDARERGKAAGFDHYLVKPISLEDLREALFESS